MQFLIYSTEHVQALDLLRTHVILGGVNCGFYMLWQPFKQTHVSLELDACPDINHTWIWMPHLYTLEPHAALTERHGVAQFGMAGTIADL